MFKSVLAASAVVLLSSAAFAADLPAPEVPVIAQAPVAAYDWTGIYIGANVGYAWGKINPGKGFKDEDIDGIAGGAQIGGNWQFDKFVAGLETDVSGTGLDASNKSKFDPQGGIFGTVRGRAGIAIDRFFLYGTGGFAYSNISVKNQDDFKLGWTAGGGGEFAIDNNWSVKIEYLYADLGDDKVKIKGDGKVKYDYTQNLIRAGFNYKF